MPTNPDPAGEPEPPAAPEPPQKPIVTRKAIYLGIAVVVGLWIATPFIVIPVFDSAKDPVTPGTFGDMFGSINALFSGAALLLVSWATIMQFKALEIQQQELRLQREEMAMQRQEMKMQREEFARQSEIAAKQLALHVSERKDMMMRTEQARLPIFRFSGTAFGPYGGARVTIKNCGGAVYGVRLSEISGVTIPGSLQTDMSTGESFSLGIEFKSMNEPAIFAICFEISGNVSSEITGEMPRKCTCKWEWGSLPEIIIAPQTSLLL